MTLLSHVAQNIMDAYYQNNAADEDFFELYHFKFLAAASYHALLQAEYEKSYQMNRGEGRQTATIPDDWYIAEPATISQSGEEFIATLRSEILAFRYDTQTLGLGPVLLPGNRKSCIRITVKDLYKLALVPFTRDVYAWIVAGNRQLCFAGNTLPPKVTVFYIPVCDPLNEQAVIPETMVDAIIKNVWQFMAQAKSQKPFINMSNDQNPNVNPDAEVVTTLKRLLGIGAQP